MALAEDLERVAAAAAPLAEGRSLAGVLATEPAVGRRVYVCAYEAPDGTRGWLALGDDGEVLQGRREVRDAVSIAALCEVAEEAALRLQHVLGAPPQLSSPGRLDAIGQAARRLELALDPTAPSPFTSAMRSAAEVADALWGDVESAYLVPLE